MYMVSFNGMELNAKEPVYLQLKNHIKKKILANEIIDYDELPSRRETAMALSINPNTVQKAYKQLEEEGILHTISNVRSVIIVNDEIIEKIQAELLDGMMKSFVEGCRDSGLDFQQTVALLTKHWGN